jgi:hypothetical protein
MKKLFILFGPISLIFLMVSNASAVPQIHSEPIMKNINNYEQQVTLLEEKLEFYIEKLGDINLNIQPTGLFDFIIAIIQAIINILIDIINSIAEFIQDVMGLLSALVNAVKHLIDVIIQFIEWLQGLFEF